MLLVAFLLEGWSTLAAFKEFRIAKGSLGWVAAVQRSKTRPASSSCSKMARQWPASLSPRSGSASARSPAILASTALASIVIGLILAVTACVLAYESKALLIGEAADPELVAALREMVERRPGVTGVGEILTVHGSPDQITAMLSVDFDDE